MVLCYLIYLAKGQTQLLGVRLLNAIKANSLTLCGDLADY